MKRCPNCAQEAIRTSDWVCQWCGFPLVSGSFKKIDKTYRELKEERMPQPRMVLEAEEPEEIQEPEAKLEVETEIELEEEVGVEPVPESEPELESEPVPEPEPVSKPKPRARRKPAAGKKTTSTAKTTTETKPVKSTTRRKTSVRSRPAPEVATKTALSTAGIEITVSELLSEYQIDAEAADARFANQVIRITGVIDRVEVKDAFNIYFINLISSEADRLLQGVKCVFNSKYGSKLSQLVNGQTVMVQGEYSGSVIDISLKDCILVD
ncbi:MAG: hypothetical protein V3R96_00945 [Dehalococcoidales bacterium]